MPDSTQIEKAVLGLPPADRAHLALMAWESLADDPGFAASPAFDPEGLALAGSRDREIESGAIQPLTHETFLRRTSGTE